MKKKLSALLATALMLSTFSGCAPKVDTPPDTTPDHSGVTPSEQEGENDGRTDINLMVLSGPTGVGAAKLLEEASAEQTKNDYEITVAAANDEVTAALINGSADIAAVATNVAANLSAKTDGSIQVMAVNTLGVLYLLEKGDTVHALSDLAGKTLYATGQGANPEYVLNYLLKENGVEPEQVDIQWMTAQEVTAKMATEENAVCMLPVPAATALMVKDESVREALSLSAEWDKLEQGALAMGCVVVRTEFAEQNPEAVADFLEEYHSSIDYVNDPANLTDAASLVAQFGITANNTIATQAIPQCNLTYLDGETMRDTLEQYYTILFQANPASIGGAMPYDSFYYGVE